MSHGLLSVYMPSWLSSFFSLSSLFSEPVVSGATIVCKDTIFCTVLATGLLGPLLKYLRFASFRMCFIICLAICCIATIDGNDITENMQQFSTIEATTIINNLNNIERRECLDITISSECASFQELNGCTVVKGTLKIVLMPHSNSLELCNYSAYSFPLLREITDYMIFYDVRGLISIRELFPNLTVIRGRRLFLNYALGISNMPDLQTLEFRSLVAIQRGHVYIGAAKQLCQLERINFDRLTLSSGENHIIPYNPAKCLVKPECKGCPSVYCWSNLVCQKFENDNVAVMLRKSHHCHAECLGGCYNSTNTGCAVCRGITDHGACVSQCPLYKFYMEHHQRCYTRDECVKKYKHFVHEHNCVENCPSGFTVNSETGVCVHCSDEHASKCMNVCNPDSTYLAATIFSLADAEIYKGCHIINGSLVITIRNKVDEEQLFQLLGSIREIYGHLKIYRSQHLSSLKFLRNLQIIHGRPLENELYAIIVYDNRNLLELWQPKKDTFKIMRGGLYIQANNKLCNQVLQKFRGQVLHDKAIDSVQISDQEVLCGPAKLLMDVEILSHNTIRASWLREQTVERVEILYRLIPPNSKYVPETELDIHICRRNEWKRRLMFSHDIAYNDTHYMFPIRDLRSHTQYEVLVKTFDTTGEHDARSEVKIVRTQLDIPPAPNVQLIGKNDSSLTIKVSNDEEICPNCVQYYQLEIYQVPEEQDMLDQRNFCAQPILKISDESENVDINEEEYVDGYELCCAQQEEAAEHEEFAARMRKEFVCDRDHKKNCPSLKFDNYKINRLQHLNLDPSDSNYTLTKLLRFRQYSVQLKSCNDLGCSAITILNERTNYSVNADRLEQLYACKVSNTTPTEYHIYFTEPRDANAAVLSYVVHYRSFLHRVRQSASHLTCVTRAQHARNNNVYVVSIPKANFNQVAVRVYSLATDIMTSWVDVTDCAQYDAIYAQYMRDLVAVETFQIHHGFTFNTFVLCFMAGGIMVFVWFIYKQRYWRQLAIYYRHWRMPRNVPDFMRLEERQNPPEDREILVQRFDAVRYHRQSTEDLNSSEL